jgi:fatty-acyl-CoA synthase
MTRVAAIRASGQQDPSARAWLRAIGMTARIDDDASGIFPLLIEERAKLGDMPALTGTRESLTYAQLAARVRRYANWARAQGLGKGDTVAVMLDGCPDYVALWAGITRMGAVAALINTNLRGDALAHCLDLAAPRLIIVAEELAAEVENVACGATVWRHDEGFRRFIAAFSDAPPRACALTLEDNALLIYTSGTTGLPKAAPVSHRRVMLWTHWFAGMMAMTPDDRIYNCLPMYHSVGGVAAPGGALVAGASAICREKFSARAFWDDITDSGATIFQYIGELCRYLLAGDGPKRPHKLRLACGNGLSGSVWAPFQERFAIPQILEFYAATEGNFSLYNMEGKPGAVGRVPALLAPGFPIALVKYDEASGQPLRTRDGYCIPVKRGEAGEAICKINEGPARFEGYTDAQATAKKILRHAFARGDAWFRSGDLMRQDEEGFFYFVDRMGDTFRWKGENVATAEVAGVLGAAPGVCAAAVYGVAVPGMEGRAGMAALEVSEGFDLASFRDHAAARLPAYARPVFLRITTALSMTGTFKHRKTDLARDGFDPARTADPLFADVDGGYADLDAALYARIIAGQARL